MLLPLGTVRCPRAAAATPHNRLTCHPSIWADSSWEAASNAADPQPAGPWRRWLHTAASGTLCLKAACNVATTAQQATASIIDQGGSWRRWVQAATSGAAAVLLAHSLLLQPPAAAAYGDPLPHHSPTEGMERSIKGQPSLAEEATLDADSEAEEWLEQYAQYVKSMAPQEQAPGCELCRSNRLMLEVTWDTVADRYYDPTGHFSQEQWARQLLVTLQEAGGVLPTTNDAYRALDNMIASLHDRYSQFLSPSKFREALHQPRPVERQYLAAQYVAAGVVIGGHSSLGGWYVESALAESPAEEAGVSRGDRILTVNGLAVDRLSPSEVTALLRGPGGSTVEVGLVDKAGHTRWLELTRRGLPQPPTRQANLLAPGGRTVKYVRVHYFSAGTARCVREVLLQGEGEEVDGYILDLRNNPGGSFDAAVGIADMLLPAGAPITSTVRSLNELDGEWVAGQLSFGATQPGLPPSLSDKPLVLLTNSTTASASEVLAGALHDNGRAAIVGETTFGKGVVQEYFGETDGSGIKLTVAKYLTPLGYDISRQGGIRPDAVCHDHPRGLTGLPDTCIAKALHGIAAELDAEG